MAIKLSNIRTGNTALPIYNPTPTEVEIAGMANRMVWTEGDAGYFSTDQTKWFDRGTGAIAGYGIVGNLGIAGGSINEQPCALYSKAQSVLLQSSGFPVGGDYSLAWAGELADLTTGQALFTGDSSTLYHAVLIQTTGKIAVYHSGANHLLTTLTLAPETPYVITFNYVEATKIMTVIVNGTVWAANSMVVDNVDPTLRFGNLVAGTNLQFGGLDGTKLVFARNTAALLAGQTQSDLTVYTSYLRTKYAA